MSHDKDSLIRLFNRMAALKEGMGWVSKGKIDDALKEWSREDRYQYSLLMEALNDLDNIEKARVVPPEPSSPPSKRPV